MGILVRQGTYNSIALYIGIVLGAVNTILLFPKVLSEEVYGLTRVIVSFSFIASQLSLLGTTTSIIKHFPKYSEESRSEQFIGFNVIVMLAGLLVFILTMFLLQDVFIHFFESSAKTLVDNKVLLLPYIVGMVVFELVAAISRAKLKTVPSLIIKEIVVRIIQTIGCILIIYSAISEHDFLLIFSWIHVIAAILMILIFIKDLRIALPHFDKATRRSLFDFQAMNLLNSLTSNLATYLDVIMIGALIVSAENTNYGLIAAGLYGFASYIATLITVPARAIQNISVPLVAKAIHNNDNDEINFIYKSTSKYQLLLGLFIYAVVLTSLSDFLVFVPKFSAASEIVWILGIAKLIDVTAGLNGQIISNSKYYRSGTLFMIIYLCLIISTNFLLINKFGLVGAAYATVISVLLFNIIKYFFVLKKFNTSPFSIDTIKILAVGLMFILLGSYLPTNFSGLVNIILKSSIVSAGMFLCFYFLKVIPELQSFLQNIRLKR